jgi:PhoPQ-activated pathogenicity-related protein
MRRTVMALVPSVIITSWLTAAVAKGPSDLPPALQNYVAADDEAFGWKIRDTQRGDGFLMYDVDLTSQVWQGITWKHALTIFIPQNIRHKDVVLLFISGGSIGNRPGDGDVAMARQLASAAQMPVALLNQVPNQPLLGGRKEDDLISETFLRYLDTKDTSWPLLFPMAKSAVKAMDALQEIAREKHGTEVTRFVVTGGSKRGWTTWLSAVVDERVAGIAPIVIDTLNFPAQMKHQMATWGMYSEQIADYTSKGLVEIMLKQPEIPLWRWVDPYTYCRDLQLPKLLIHGTNDRYWVIDAMNVYWDALVGPKHVLYVPNAGHSLDGGKEGALTTLAVFAQNVAMNSSLPQLTWKHEDDGDAMRLVVQSNPAPQRVRLWIAHSDDKDFRNDKWSQREMSANDEGPYVVHMDRPDSGHVAFFAEATYSVGDREYALSTQMRQR